LAISPSSDLNGLASTDTIAVYTPPYNGSPQTTTDIVGESHVVSFWFRVPTISDIDPGPGVPDQDYNILKISGQKILLTNNNSPGTGYIESSWIFGLARQKDQFDNFTGYFNLFIEFTPTFATYRVRLDETLLEDNEWHFLSFHYNVTQISTDLRYVLNIDGSIEASGAIPGNENLSGQTEMVVREIHFDQRCDWDRFYLNVQDNTQTITYENYFDNGQVSLANTDSFGTTAGWFDADSGYPDGDTPVYWLYEPGSDFGDNHSLTGLDLSFSGTDTFGPPGPLMDPINFASDFQLNNLSGFAVYADSQTLGESSSGTATKPYFVDDYMDEDPYVADGYVAVDYFQETVYVKDKFYILAGFSLAPEIDVQSQFATSQTASNTIGADTSIESQSQITQNPAIDIGADSNLFSESAVNILDGFRLNADSSIASDFVIDPTANLTLSGIGSLNTQTDTNIIGGVDLSSIASLLAQADATINASNQIGFFDRYVDFDYTVEDYFDGIGNIQNQQGATTLDITAGLQPGGNATLTSTTQINSVAGFRLDSIANLDTQSQTDIVGGVDIDMDALTMLSESTTTPNAGLLFDVSQSLASDTQTSLTGSLAIILDGGINLDSQATATGTANLSISAGSSMAGQFTTVPSVGLISSNFSNILFNSQTNFVGGLNIGANSTLQSQSETSALGGRIFDAQSSLASDLQVAGSATMFIGPDLTISSASDIQSLAGYRLFGTSALAGQSTVITEGNYLFAVPLYARLNVPSETRIGNILPESRVFALDSETRINTVLPESRGLLVPQDKRTLKMHDRSL